MFHTLLTVIPSEIRKNVLTPNKQYCPTSTIFFHPKCSWNPTSACFTFRHPACLELASQAPQIGLLALLSSCVDKTDWITGELRQHLRFHLVPLLMLSLICTDPADMNIWCESLLPPHLQNPNTLLLLQTFMSQFITCITNDLLQTIDSYRNTFFSACDFYTRLINFARHSDLFLKDQVLRRSVSHVPSYHPRIKRDRIAIYAHLEPVIHEKCAIILASTAPRILLFDRILSRENFLSPAEWKLLSLSLPVHLSPKAQKLVDDFQSKLYPPQGSPSSPFRHYIKPGGGCGWAPPGLNLCMLQLLTYIQPNWKELWAGMRWNQSTEMQKRLTWLQEHDNELVLPPRSILHLLFQPG